MENFSEAFLFFLYESALTSSVHKGVKRGSDIAVGSAVCSGGSLPRSTQEQSKKSAELYDNNILLYSQTPANRCAWQWGEKNGIQPCFFLKTAIKNDFI